MQVGFLEKVLVTFLTLTVWVVKYSFLSVLCHCMPTTTTLMMLVWLVRDVLIAVTLVPPGRSV